MFTAEVAFFMRFKLFVPTIGSIYEAIPKDPELNVRELHKKINIIGNNIIIGWYGNALAASVLIRELRDKNKVSKLSFQDINDFFTCENIESIVGKFVIGDNNPVGFVISFLCNGSIQNLEFFTGTPNLPTEISIFNGKGTVRLYGSGHTDFYNYFSSNLHQIDQEFHNLNDVCDWIHRLFLRVSSNFLAKEILSQSTIVLSYYGGYYDFAAISQGQIIERKEHTYFFWEVVPEVNNHKPQAKLCFQGMKTEYLEQDITRCLSWTTFKDSSNSDAHVSLHYISPADMKLYELECSLKSNNINVDELNFNSEYSCHYIVIRDQYKDSNQYQSIVFVFKGSDLSEHPVQITNQLTKIKYSFNTDIARQIEEVVSAIWEMIK